MPKQKDIDRDYIERWNKESKGKFAKLEKILKELSDEKKYMVDYKVTGVGNWNPPAYLILKKKSFLFFSKKISVLEADLIPDYVGNKIEHFMDVVLKYKKEDFAEQEIKELYEKLKGISMKGPYFYEWGKKTTKLIDMDNLN